MTHIPDDCELEDYRIEEMERKLQRKIERATSRCGGNPEGCHDPLCQYCNPPEEPEEEETEEDEDGL